MLISDKRAFFCSKLPKNLIYGFKQAEKLCQLLKACIKFSDAIYEKPHILHFIIFKYCIWRI